LKLHPPDGAAQFGPRRRRQGGHPLNKKEEMILKATKEIVVKLIETGRVYPSSLEENFQLVNRVVRASIQDDEGQE
jgi:hypothetical protein